MLLALRSLYETETPAITPPPAGRVFHELGHPLIPQKGVARARGSEIKLRGGSATASGRAKILTVGSQFRFDTGTAGAGGRARAEVTGNEIRFESGTAKAIGISDDEEAIFFSLIQ